MSWWSHGGKGRMYAIGEYSGAYFLISEGLH